ncbi:MULTISPECIES: glucan ABC transporter ATP-binding protein/ permease [Rhizobium/Agrobacterium group]|uniref:Beta (1-->2) glucan export ATP-binding protein n=2 Tax=Rhizobium/Agrobacterium group TaxID=227290 RepID=B9JV39_ALLAM|nr:MULTISPECIES: glucan ABC transporter ATP-binding protein/ permease [Rhizobium/Agrobacterium group]ACM38177.1 beta (1-->2) glucan export ATP-binding protein [Allorhizobium ampelinum S4]MCF1435911.1 glucan ABC transporter ATP-binding protein/ permease [Allorhizobium ampelinum]MCF1446971.1 glucan ABC transporter ATP-binding protein/ permease [Allorhizobium ampelinum]MCF1474077.1 glucan ABC transporter ATP-binding protein/ permease [Allorhizobium ampelinum]MCF1484745.1 glucan ABC transporter AT
MSLLQIYWRALQYLAAYRLKVSIVVAANIILAVITIAEPILFGWIIDAISSGKPVKDILFLWGGFGIFNTIAFVLVAREADRLAHGRRASLLTEAFGRIISMPLSWHHQRGTSNALHTLLRASETLFGLWLEFMRTHLATAVALVLLVPTAFSMDVRLTLVLIVLGLIYVAIGKMVMDKTKDGQASVESHYHTVFSHVSDTISNVSVVHSYNRIQAETSALKTFTSKLLDAQYPVLDWWAIASGLNRIASTASMLIILIIGTMLVQSGELRVGDVIAFIGFANLLIARLDQMRQFSTQIFEARAKLEDFYVLEDSVQDRDEPVGNRDLQSVRGDVEFRHVSFDFANTTQGVKDVSFTVKAGQTIAIVGPTGAGKTTLINLLQRVHEPQQGQILIDGADISTITRQSLRNSIATVFQDAGILNRSIADNIRIGRENATDEDIVKAAEAAAATDFIESRLSGFDTDVGERGNRLSGGERQRIAIARAILKDAPILVLDEATSALDVETEERVKSAIDRLRQNRTTFIIAHRLSTVREADQVLFLDHGRIVEMGGYDELSAKGGRFAALLHTSGLLNDDDKVAVKA